MKRTPVGVIHLATRMTKGVFAARATFFIPANPGVALVVAPANATTLTHSHHSQRLEN
jgi:hypothetical protein